MQFWENREGLNAVGNSYGNHGSWQRAECRVSEAEQTARIRPLEGNNSTFKETEEDQWTQSNAQRKIYLFVINAKKYLLMNICYIYCEIILSVKLINDN